MNEKVIGSEFNPSYSKNKWAYAFDKDMWIQFEVARAPNWFNRMMQLLILGIRWKKFNCHATEEGDKEGEKPEI